MSTLELEDLHFTHDPSSEWVLNDLSLQLNAGETAIIIGDNGSGKSTLGKLIAGLSRAQSGTVLVDQTDVQSMSVSVRPKHVMYMGQTSYLQFFRSSIDEEIRFAARLSGFQVQEAEEAYPRFRLPGDRTVKPMDLAYPAMWRLQLFLFSFVFSPTVLFIDEIVAPGARAQIDALDAVVAERSRRNQVTILAYQRVLPALATEKVRRFELRDGRLQEGGRLKPVL